MSHLQHVVLHDISNYAVLIKVAPSPLRAKGLLEADLHTSMASQ